jgi:dipeptidyl aminopeptidase/acylaminoacyl peptidase
MADADEVGAASASQPMAIPEDKVMRIYPQLPERQTGWHRSEAHRAACVQPRLEAAMRSVTPVSRARRGAWTLGLTALLVLACRDSSAPIIGSMSRPPETPPAPPETPPTEIVGPEFAYVEASGPSAAIFLVISTGSRVRLSPLEAFDLEPAWSPDGSRIAFTSGENGGKSDIYIMNASGGNRVRLTTDGRDTRPAWSHDGARIAFESRRDGNSEIYVMNADGSHQTRLTFRDNAADSEPAWSPDGTRIAFVTCEPINSGNCQRDSSTSRGIFVITADGAETVQLTSNYTDTAPAWSPDGSRIAFSSEIGGTSLIFVMKADGSGRAPYSPYAGATDPSWSPDGTRIAFVALQSCDYWDYYSDCSPQIFIGRPDGSIYSVPKKTYVYPSDPAWRP